MTAVPRVEGERAVRRRGARVELARLGDRAARELGAADPGREAEVVLDPAGRPRLAAERGALDDERVEPFGGAVDRGREACGAAADDQQVDLLARRELEPDPERAHHLAGSWTVQLSPAGEPHERELAAVRRAPRPARCTAAGSRARSRGFASSARTRAGRRSRGRSPRTLCNASRREMNVERSEVAERAVLVEKRAQGGALDCDVPKRLGHERVDEDGLPRQEVQLAEEAGGAVPDELVSGRVDDRDLSFEDRHERIGPIADPVQQLTGRRRALLADLGESGELRRGEQSGSRVWTRSFLRDGEWCRSRQVLSSGNHVPGVDGRVSLQSRRRCRSAQYQLPSIMANASRYRSEAIMISRLPSSGKRWWAIVSLSLVARGPRNARSDGGE